MTFIDEMVNRFLMWSLPKTFAPDCGISFDGRKPDSLNPDPSWPIGTNLFTAEEARAMLTHALGEAMNAVGALQELVEAEHACSDPDTTAEALIRRDIAWSNARALVAHYAGN